MINKITNEQPTDQSVLKKGSAMSLQTNKKKDLMESQEIYIKLSKKEINTLIFQLQERIEHYQLQEKYGVSTAYLEGIQNKLIESRKGIIK